MLGMVAPPHGETLRNAIANATTPLRLIQQSRANSSYGDKGSRTPEPPMGDRRVRQRWPRRARPCASLLTAANSGRGARALSAGFRRRLSASSGTAPGVSARGRGGRRSPRRLAATRGVSVGEPHGVPDERLSPPSPHGRAGSTANKRRNSAARSSNPIHQSPYRWPQGSISPP
jgi:hypothetical protein